VRSKINALSESWTREQKDHCLQVRPAPPTPTTSCRSRPHPSPITVHTPKAAPRCLLPAHPTGAHWTSPCSALCLPTKLPSYVSRPSRHLGDPPFNCYALLSLLITPGLQETADTFKYSGSLMPFIMGSGGH
jgi:hypothetical protein